MADDRLRAVAGWLAEQPHRLIPYAALRGLVQPGPGEGWWEAGLAVRAALNRLDAAGLITFAHHQPPAVGVRDREGLRAIALAARRMVWTAG